MGRLPSGGFWQANGVGAADRRNGLVDMVHAEWNFALLLRSFVAYVRRGLPWQRWHGAAIRDEVRGLRG